jgi:hypothetical protein
MISYMRGYHLDHPKNSPNYGVAWPKKKKKTKEGKPRCNKVKIQPMCKFEGLSHFTGKGS